jgi:hypothetical protein
MSGPFIVSHRSAGALVGQRPAPLSVKAVADLDEAHKVAQWPIGGLHVDWEVARAQVLMIGSEGGKVELPDGSVVEVEATTDIDLRKAVEMWGSFTLADVIAEWNRRHGIEAQSEGVSS